MSHTGITPPPPLIKGLLDRESSHATVSLKREKKLQARLDQRCFQPLFIFNPSRYTLYRGHCLYVHRGSLNTHSLDIV
jgi:hypothetical protein